MKTLYEIAKIIKRNRRISDSIIPSDEQSTLKKLYEMLFLNHELTDSDAMIKIYGKKNIVAFSRLKTRLREYLIRSILLQTVPAETTDSRVNEALNGYRYTLASRVLIAKKAKTLGIELAEKSIKKSMKYHATENVLLQSKMLVNNYGGSEYNKYKYKKYLSIQEKYLKIYMWELKAENYFNELQRIQLQSLANASETTIKMAKKFSDELDAVNIHSYFFALTKYKVKAAYLEYTKNYEALLQLSEKALKEFSAPDFRSENAIHTINIRRTWALIQAGRNDQAIKLGNQLISKTVQGSLSWYLIGHYAIKAHIYAGDYIGAAKLIKKLLEHSNYQKLGENYKEIFQTTLGYIHLIVDSKLLEGVPIKKEILPDFKLGKFLNEVPVFSKDKRGINVSILLMHIAYLLQRKNYNLIIDRVDALNQYAYRYLRRDDSFRSTCMIKIVGQMARSDFNLKSIDRHTELLVKNLKKVNLAGSGENIETEVIPYEILWEIMKKSL